MIQKGGPLKAAFFIDKKYYVMIKFLLLRTLINR